MKSQEPDFTMTKLLSVDQVAHLLGVSTFTVRRLVKAGVLASVRVGKRLLIPGVEVERIAKTGCDAASPRSDGSKPPVEATEACTQ